MAHVLSDEQSAAVAKGILRTADAISEFRVTNFAELELEERKELAAQEDRLRWMANLLLDLEIILQVEDLEKELKQIDLATKRAKTAFARVKKIERGIAIATALIKLGAAVTTGHPGAITEAIGGVAEAVKEGDEKEES